MRRFLGAAVLPGMLLGAGWMTGQSTVDQAAQKPAEGAQNVGTNGVKTGAAHGAVLDEKRRPITAGGFVTTGPRVFDDVAQKAGLTRWHHTMGTPDKHFIIETVGSGVALLDYDGDGWLDIYLVNGSTYEAERARARHRTPRFFITTMTARLPM